MHYYFRRGEFFNNCFPSTWITSVYCRQSHCIFLTVYKWKLQTSFLSVFSLNTLICKDPLRSAKAREPATSNDFFFVITWILLTHVLRKLMQEGLFCFHATVSIPTSQGDKVLWYKTFFFFLLYQMPSYYWSWYVCTLGHQKTC